MLKVVISSWFFKERTFFKRDYGYPYFNSWGLVKENYNYDSYGNRTRMQDPNGNVTNWYYDTIYHAHSIKETNALNQSTHWYYYGINGSSYNTSNRPYGMLEKITDPNEVTVKQLYYDPLQRVTKMIEPGDSSTHPTTKYTYYFDGNAPEYVRTEKCENSGASGVLTSYAYMDGLGRVSQEKSEAQNAGHYVTVDTYYDSRGLLATRSVPYDTNTANYGRSSSAKHTAYTYDAIRRLTRTTYPDTTTERRAYNRWRVTVTNPRGKQIITTYYGDGLVKQVQEKNGSSTYTTNYKYNTGVSELAQIIDHKGNVITFGYDMLGRKTAMVDPDMGNWSYAYNAFGELISQTTATGDSTTMTNDLLGRMVSRTDIDGGTSTVEGDAAWIKASLPTVSVNWPMKIARKAQ